jgi:hypothetical protein
VTIPTQFRRNSLKCLTTVFIALIAMIGTAGSLTAQDTKMREPLVLVTSTGEHEFKVEIAATRNQQSRGLMFRRSMDARQGMLFVYDEAQYVSMWMRNTYISLDMVFIRADGKVHRVEASTEPLSERIIESGDKVFAVLELVGGTAAKLNLKPGDVVRQSRFKSAAN